MIDALIDTNVILDFLLERQPFCVEAKAVFQNLEDDKIRGYITASSVTDIFYLLKKELGRQNAVQCILELIEIVDILGVDKIIISNALQLGLSDFEDAVQAQTAIENGIEIIITRNAKDFQQLASMEILSPSELIERLA
ncbi:MAG: PIN domain-containing protein [Prevotellaceae bacterium]|jgi:predicted nucleic acid-binding protein|nr:PIN domain-containing protein [Prevotellaceae bacterium]